MANVMLTRGGAYYFGNVGLCRAQVYPSEMRDPPARTAGEYHHGLFTFGGAFNPMFSIGQAEALAREGVKVGDFIGLFVIPSYHTILDVAVHTIPSQTDRGFPTVVNSDGLAFTVEVRKYDKNLAYSGDVELVTALNGVAANTADFRRSSIKPADNGYFIPADETVVVGLKVDALPTGDGVTLSSVTSRVEVTGHVMDYECPMHV